MKEKNKSRQLRWEHGSDSDVFQDTILRESLL